MNDNYIILRDEDGKAYIAHADAAATQQGGRQYANWGKGAMRAGHKYIARILENGKYWYAYTQQQLQAHLQGAKNKAQNAVEEATGVAARKRMDEAANRRDTEAANMQINKQNREASRSNVQSARQATREAEAERNRSEAALKGLKEKWKSDNEKAVDVSSKAVDALTRKYAAESKARKADLDSLLSMPWEFQKRRDAKTVQADAWREAQQAENERKALHDEHDRIDKSRELTKKAYNTELEKSVDAWNQRAQALRNQDTAEKNHQVAQDKFNESRAAYREADSDYNKNKAAYDKSLAGAVDRTVARARDVASDVRETASSAFSKAKDATNNAVSNAANAYERMKDEFKQRTGTDLKERAQTAEKEAQRAESERRKAAGKFSSDVDRDLASRKALDKNPNSAHAQAERDQAVAAVRKSGEEYYKEGGALDTAQKARDEAAKAREEYKDFKDSHSPKAMIDQAKKAAIKPVQGMIDNARSSTAKAVNEAWEKIPKNADGSVNPFDKNFQSTYNDWKAKKDKYDSSLAGRAKDAAEKATDSVMDMIDQAKRTARDTVASAQSTIDNATGNNYRKRAQEANQAAENAINQRSRTNDQLENQRSKYGSKENDQDHIYGDSEGYYYKTKEQRDRAEALISKRDQYDADIVNNNRASKVNDSMYADSKAGKINDILGRSNVSTSDRANSKATEVQNKWDRQEAESKLIGGRLDPDVNVSKEYVYSRASNSGMAGQVRQVKQLEEAMRSAERAYDSLGNDSSKPQSSSRAARQKMLQAQDAYEKAYEELIDDINKQYDRDLAAYEKQYGKYTR